VTSSEREYQIDNNGIIKLEFTEEEVANEKYSLIQNAGSGIDKKHNGYDIGFGELDGDKFAQPYEINNGCGAAIILKKQDFIDCGMFDEQFFMYYEDTDLSYRIKKLGKKIMYCPDAVVRHIHTGSSTEWSDFFLYHVYRNKLLFVWKNESKYYFVKYFIRQYLDGVKNKSRIRKIGTVDALKVVQGKQNIKYKRDVE
jgi:GT2 family glycosyltransferase